MVARCRVIGPSRCIRVPERNSPGRLQEPLINPSQRVPAVAHHHDHDKCVKINIFVETTSEIPNCIIKGDHHFAQSSWQNTVELEEIKSSRRRKVLVIQPE